MATILFWEREEREGEDEGERERRKREGEVCRWYMKRGGKRWEGMEGRIEDIIRREKRE